MTHIQLPSPASSSDEPPKKRSRVGKPKVRTGCITWFVSLSSSLAYVANPIAAS